jgi:hypothetical protein
VSFYLRCMLCGMAMAATGSIMDLFDRIGLGRTRLYDLIDRTYDWAWNRLEDAAGRWASDCRNVPLVDSLVSGTIQRKEAPDFIDSPRRLENVLGGLRGPLSA